MLMITKSLPPVEEPRIYMSARPAPVSIPANIAAMSLLASTMVSPPYFGKSGAIKSPMTHMKNIVIRDLIKNFFPKSL